MDDRDDLILLTGATGYVGSRLLTRLEAGGRRVRCLARRPTHLREVVGAETEVVKGDLLEPTSLEACFEGVEVAVYLVHSMGGDDFEARDAQAARNFAEAAKRAGVRRIVYLGGLGEDGDRLSAHLRSRHEVGRLLLDSDASVIELRASIVLGAGSLSFELVRALVERLPIMITPRWVRVKAQPIAIDDVLSYLAAAVDLPGTESRVYEIGGTDQVSYGDIMRAYAEARGLRRLMIPVPALTPRLSSLWLGLVTPIYARVGRKLVDSIRHPTIVRDPAARKAFDIQPVGLEEAMQAALRVEDTAFAETRWCDALSATTEAPQWGMVRFGERLVDSRQVKVAVPPAAAFTPIRRIGGARGWYHASWLWRIRGFLDLLAGGVGVRRGRRDPETLRVGDTVDFWRVEDYEPDRRLRLSAEMKLPGRAWLQFEVEPDGPDASIIRQTAVFDPVGLLGRLYWLGVFPLHAYVFQGMLRKIQRRALRLYRKRPR